LNTIVSSRCASRRAVSVDATARQTDSLSSEHGPAMRRSFAGSKIMVKPLTTNCCTWPEVGAVVPNGPEFGKRMGLLARAHGEVAKLRAVGDNRPYPFTSCS